MRKISFSRQLFCLLLAAGYLLSPFIIFAQSTGQVDFTNVVPDIANAQGTGGAGNFIGWIQNFYQFSLIAGVFLAVGVIVWAGLRYALAAGNPSGQSDARDQILQALLGLILLFGAFLILYTINPNLVNLSLPTLRSVSVGAPVNNSAPAAGGLASRTAGAGITSTQAGQIFLRNRVDVKPGAGLNGLQESVIDEVVNLRNELCRCGITVTEGTGGVHRSGTYSHANGYKVDLRSLEPGTNTPNALTRYIEGNPSTFVPIGTRSDGAPQYRAPNGAIYARESNHWDVVVRGG